MVGSVSNSCKKFCLTLAFHAEASGAHVNVASNRISHHVKVGMYLLSLWLLFVPVI